MIIFVCYILIYMLYLDLHPVSCLSVVGSTTRRQRHGVLQSMLVYAKQCTVVRIRAQ